MWDSHSYSFTIISFLTRSGRGVQHYGIKFVSDLRQVGGFLRVIHVSSTNKTDRNNITEIMLKVALNTIKQTNKQTNRRFLLQAVHLH